MDIICPATARHIVDLYSSDFANHAKYVQIQSSLLSMIGIGSQSSKSYTSQNQCKNNVDTSLEYLQYEGLQYAKVC